MKKVLLILLVLVQIFTLQGCFKSDVITDYKELEERGYIIVGLDDTFAPMGFRNNNNELIGFDIDLANAVFNYLDVEVRFQPVDWNSKELELKSGRIDLIWNGLSITKERELNMLFSKAYLANKQIILTRSNEEINRISDLKAKNVGVQISSAADTVLSNSMIVNEVKQVIKYDTYAQALLELDSKTIDAVIMDEIMARYIISQKDGLYKVVKEEFSSELYGIGMRLKSTSLKEKIDEALLYLEENDLISSISEKWFEEDIYNYEK